MLQCCVRRHRLSSVTLCIVAKLCVLEQKLLLRAYRKSYEKSIGTKINDLDLCLEVVSRSRQPLRYIRRWISRKPLEIEAWFQRTTNRKWHTGYRMVTWLITSLDLERSNSWPQYAGSAIFRKRLDLETPFQRATNRKWHMGFQMVTWPMTSRDSQRCLWCSTVGYPSDSLGSCCTKKQQVVSVIFESVVFLHMEKTQISEVL